MANISQKVNLTANQRMDIAEFMAIQTNLENAVTRLVQLIGSPIVDPVTNIQWNVNGVLTPSSITVSGADLVIGSGLEVMCKDGHIITQDANYTMTGVLPLGATKALMAKPLAEAQASPDNRRFWDNGTTQEVNGTPNTVLTRQLDFAFVPNAVADIEDAVNNGDYVFIATVSSDGSTVVWKNAFPHSGTLQLPSLLAVVKRLIGDGNENSGLYSASCGGRDNTNSGLGSASSGGYSNTNSGEHSASSGGSFNVNSGSHAASGGGRSNTNTGICSASSGGSFNVNSGTNAASCGGSSNTNSGTESASSGGSSNTNSGYRSASSGGYFNTNSGDYSASSGGYSNINLAAAIRGITLGGQRNMNGGLQSVILGQYCENATDDVICGGYNTTLTPSGANQNLKWVLSNRYGTAHFASDVKVGGNVNDGTAPKAKILGSSGNTYIGGDVEIGGTVTAGATPSTTPTVTITASTGAIAANGLVTAAGGVKTVTPANVVASWNAGTSEFDATMTQVGGVIEVPLDAGHPLPASVGGIIRLRLANTKITSTSRVHVTLEFSGASATKLPACICEVNDTELVVTLFNHGAAAIESSVFVQFDVINPA